MGLALSVCSLTPLSLILHLCTPRGVYSGLRLTTLHCTESGRHVTLDASYGHQQVATSLLIWAPGLCFRKIRISYYDSIVWCWALRGRVVHTSLTCRLSQLQWVMLQVDSKEQLGMKYIEAGYLESQSATWSHRRSSPYHWSESDECCPSTPRNIHEWL